MQLNFDVMPEVSPLTICGDRLNQASRTFLDSPVNPVRKKVSNGVKPENDMNVSLLKVCL